MAEKKGNTVFCGPCNYKHLTIPAKAWCPECNEGTCESCLEQHGSFSITRKHEVIDIENFQKLPDFVRDIDLFCEEHNSKIDFYCLSHNENCCLKCVPEKHKECPNVTTLEMVARDSKSSTALEDIFLGFEDLVSNINEAIQIKTKNVEDVAEEKLKLEKEIKSFRRVLDEILDKLENRTLHNLDVIFSRTKLTQNNFLRDLNARKAVVEQLHQQCKDVKTYASEVQTFLVLKKMSASLTEKEREFSSKLDDTEFQNVSLAYEANTMLKNLQTGKVKNFGSVSEIASEATFKLSHRKTDQAQFMPLPKVRSSDIKKRSLRFTQQILPNFKKDTLNIIKGCAILPDDRIACIGISGAKRLLILKPSDGSLEIVSLPISPSGITCVDDTTMAMLCTDRFEVRIFRLCSDELKEENIVCLENRDWSLSYCSGKLAVSVKGHGIRILYGNGGDITMIPINHNSPVVVHLTGDKLFFVDSLYHTVHCYSLKGQEIWQCQLSKERNQYSITSDENDLLYVSCSRSNKIIIISSDGSNMKEISIGVDDFISPIAVAFHRNRKELLCATSDGKVGFYAVTID